MRNMTFIAACALIAAPQVAHAQDFLDRINSVVNKVDQTISTGERAQRSAERVMDKMPEKEEEEIKTTNTPAPAPAPAPAPEAVEPATGEITAEEEDEILRKAREIEERRILEEAERIRKERAAKAANN